MIDKWTGGIGLIVSLLSLGTAFQPFMNVDLPWRLLVAFIGYFFVSWALAGLFQIVSMGLYRLSLAKLSLKLSRAHE
jgi:hypothetical protein